jgi:arylsulfatase A-like enzyme
MIIDDKRSSLLNTLAILTGIVLFLQLALSASNMLVYIGKNNVFSNTLLHEIFTSRVVVLSLLQLLVAQLVTYAVYICAIWYAAVSIGEFYKLQWQRVYHLGVFIWFFSVITIISANNYFFPRSFFSTLINENIFHQPLTINQLRCILIPAVFMIAGAGILLAINLVMSLRKKINFLRHSAVLVFLLVIAMIISMARWAETAGNWRGGSQDRPNIIVIGLDALRPDFVNDNSRNALPTPNINHFLRSAVNFTDAYTPISQTFPAWVSILTAQEPKINHIRANMVDPNLINPEQMLPQHLQQLGYETIYATDDLRFDTILARFGFNHIVGPAVGINNFIIGTFNDFPLSNLIIPTAAGKWLFPYNYGNHEAVATYAPENFLQLIKESLHNASDKPLFFAVHFNTSGWPFGMSRSKLQDNDPWYTRYQEGVPIADKQFGEFLDILKERHILDHAIVVLLSDHGITLGLPGDRMITETLYQGNKANLGRLRRAEYLKSMKGSAAKNEHGLDTSYGYGGDVLSERQYNVLLAFKSYGVSSGPARNIRSRASLLDIAPTILDILQQPDLAESHGVSLKPFLAGMHYDPKMHALFLESFNDSIAPQKSDTMIDSVKVALSAYSFDKKTGLVFEDRYTAEKQLPAKARAVFKGDWLLAEMPGLLQLDISKTPIVDGRKKSATKASFIKIQVIRDPSFMVLLNFKTRQWTTELNTVWAKAAPLTDLCQEMHHFYGTELTCPDCCKLFLSG